MSPTAKKGAWGIIGVGTGVIALVTFAFTVGMNVSASTHRIEMLKTRVAATENGVDSNREIIESHIEQAASDTEKIKSDISEIKIDVTRQTAILESVEKSVENINRSKNNN